MHKEARATLTGRSSLMNRARNTAVLSHNPLASGRSYVWEELYRMHDVLAHRITGHCSSRRACTLSRYADHDQLSGRSSLPNDKTCTSCANNADRKL